MLEWFVGKGPIVQALMSTLFTWFVTALGAGLVSFFKQINRRMLDGMLGFAAGAMFYVEVEELITESQMEKHAAVATIGAMLGSAVMMTLDVALG
jgi:zinc transporter ZupT